MGPLTTIQPNFQSTMQPTVAPDIRPRTRTATRPARGVVPRLLNRLSGWIDEHPWRAFAVLTAFYAAAVLALSSMKLLWLDELITLHIAQLGSVRAIWQALARGADPNPPLTHVLVMWSMKLFGVHEWALRLPAMVGYWVGMAALFAFLRRRVRPTWALAGVVLLMDMGAFEWAYESRSYALFFGFAMLAIYCWSRAASALRTSTRLWGLAGMTLALAAGLCSNYFAVLAFFPIAAAELARMAVTPRRRGIRLRVRDALGLVDWPVWLGMALAATTLLAFRALIARDIAQFTPFAWNKVSFQGVIDSYSDMVEVTLYALLPLMLFAFAIWWLGRFCGRSCEQMRPRWIGRLAATQDWRRRNLGGLTVSETAAVFVLMAYPFVGYAVASIHGGMLSSRFVMPVCFGFAIAGMLAAYWTFGHMRAAGAVMLVCCTIYFATRESCIGYWYEEQHQAFYKLIAHIPPPQYPGEPIVIADNMLILPFLHYAPKEMAARVVYPVDFPVIRYSRGEDSSDENFWAGRGTVFHFKMMPLADFQRTAGRYIIITGNRDWLLGDLLRHGYPALRLPIYTRAEPLAFWATPLSHGLPVIFEGGGDKFLKQSNYYATQPAPFVRKDNLPNGTLSVMDGGPF